MALTHGLTERPQHWPRVLRPENLGAFSPAATVRTYTPGARALLENAARDAERGLHVVRGLLWGVVITIFFVFSSGAPTVVRWLATAAVPFATAVWLLVWRALCRPSPPRWLPYALIVLDAWLALRGPLAIETPLYAALGLDRYLTRTDHAALSSAILALVAVSGAFRLDARVALFSSLVAVVSYGVVAVALGVSWNQAVLVGGLIAFTGLLGAQVARLSLPDAEGARGGGARTLCAGGVDARAGPLGRPDWGRTRRRHHGPRHRHPWLRPPRRTTDAARDGRLPERLLLGGGGPPRERERRARQVHRRRRLRILRRRRPRAAGDARGARGLAALDRYNRTRPGREPVAVGMGLHTGRALVGTIGAEQKREYTAIADAVNLAARLEELNKVYRASIVASEAVLQAVEPALRAGFVGPEVTPIRGRDSPLAVRYLPTGA